MKNVIIVHGKPSKEIYYSDKYPSSSNFAWIPWTQKQLLIQDLPTYTPEMFRAYDPEYELWRKELERYEVTPHTILVGHSAGGGFLIRWLTENPDVYVDKLILVAPSLDMEKKSTKGFCDFEMSKELPERLGSFTTFISDKDSAEVMSSFTQLQSLYPSMKVITLPGYGHFIPEHMRSSQFPELLEEVLS